MDGKQKKKHKSGGENPSQTEKEETTALDHAFFKQMLDLIPANFYFDKDAKEKLHSKRSRSTEGNGKTFSSIPAYRYSPDRFIFYYILDIYIW